MMRSATPILVKSWSNKINFSHCATSIKISKGQDHQYRKMQPNIVTPYFLKNKLKNILFKNK